MESRKTVGDIKKRFEVLHELNSNSNPISPKVNLSPQETSKAIQNIPKPVDSSNAGVNIKRTPAFRCDKGIKKINHAVKSTNINNESNTILNQTLKKTDNCINKSKNNLSETSSKIRTDTIVSNSSNCSKPAVVNRQNYVSKQIDKKIKPIDSYATPVKKPIRPNYLAVPKSSPRKTAHNHSESNTSPLHTELKQVLSSPLPSGPPPKKPPRTFAHNFKYSPDSEFNSREPCPNNGKAYPHAPSSLPSSTMRPIRSKTESQIMLKKLEHVLNQHQNLSNQSTIKGTLTNTNKSVPKGTRDPTKRYGLCLSLQESEQIMTASQREKYNKEEPVYADVRQTINKNKTLSNNNQGLHYMVSICTYLLSYISKKNSRINLT